MKTHPKRAYQIIFSSGLEYHPRKDGTLREVVAETASDALRKCVGAKVHAPGSNPWKPVRVVAVIAKPSGCKRLVRGDRTHHFNVVKNPPPAQHLVKDAKKSRAGRLVFKWAPGK